MFSTKGGNQFEVVTHHCHCLWTNISSNISVTSSVLTVLLVNQHGITILSLKYFTNYFMIGLSYLRALNTFVSYCISCQLGWSCPYTLRGALTLRPKTDDIGLTAVNSYFSVGDNDVVLPFSPHPTSLRTSIYTTCCFFSWNLVHEGTCMLFVFSLQS